MKAAQYAVRGELYLKGEELRKAGRDILYTNGKEEEREKGEKGGGEKEILFFSLRGRRPRKDLPANPSFFFHPFLLPFVGSLARSLTTPRAPPLSLSSLLPFF